MDRLILILFGLWRSVCVVEPARHCTRFVHKENDPRIATLPNCSKKIRVLNTLVQVLPPTEETVIAA